MVARINRGAKALTSEKVLSWMFPAPSGTFFGTWYVTSIEDCQSIADGEGSVITGRFITREANTIVRAEIIGPDGTIETIEGTPIHPIWSIDRNDWVSLAELEPGETLQASAGVATVPSITLATVSLPVYNVEVHGQHVYQVGKFGLVVHNACDPELLAKWGKGGFDDALQNVTYLFRKHAKNVNASDIDGYMRKSISARESRWGSGVIVEGFTDSVRRFAVHGTNPYVDADTFS